MNRLSLPGKEKHKKIILLILVLIAAGIVVYEFVENKKNKNISIDNTIKNESEYLTDGSDDSNTSIAENDLMGISQRENDMYNIAYDDFFSHNYTSSINKADEIIKEFPDSYMAYNMRGIAKAYNGDFDGAMSDIDKSLSIKSDYGYGRFNKALTYELYGQLDNALEWYNKALEVEDYVWTYYGISSIYGRRGDIDNAVKYLKKAIDIDIAVKEEAKTEPDFDPVRNSEEFKSIIQ